MTSLDPGDGPYTTLFEAIGEQRERIAFFRPVLFHAHSIDSHDWAEQPGVDAARNDPARLGTNEGVQEFLDELAKNYSVVCITDHMRCGYATRLAQAAEKREDITVLPGMEINCLPPPAYADAIHVLAAFPPTTGEVAIERIFGPSDDLPDPPDRQGTETVRFDDLGRLRESIKAIGGIFVLAHVENSRRGHRARFLVDRKKTLALFAEKDEIKIDLPEEYGVYLAELQPDAVELQHVKDQHHYARFAVGGKTHSLACVAPADHHSFEGYDDASCATMLKIPRADFESVREALRFNETRVRLPGQSTDHVAARLVGLRLISPSGKGLFTDTTVAFSPNLNCLIGPRGSGKSTIIEALRYVLGRNSQLTERTGREGSGFADLAQRTQAANLRDTRIELVYDHSDATTSVLSATFDESAPHNTRVFRPDGEDLRVGAEALLDDFPVAIFSWSELEVLGREPGPQRELVDRLLPGVRSLAAERDALRQQLASNRATISDLCNRLNKARTANGGRLGRYSQYSEAYKAINTDEAAALFSGLDAVRERKELIHAITEEIAVLHDAAADLETKEVGPSTTQRIQSRANPLKRGGPAVPTSSSTSWDSMPRSTAPETRFSTRRSCDQISWRRSASRRRPKRRRLSRRFARRLG